MSLGGSQIIPDEVYYRYLSDFKKVVQKHKNKYKFIVVCGGGSLARKYISAIKKAGKSQKFQSLSGISATRTNARFMNYFFGINPTQGIPQSIDRIKKYLNKLDIIFCGALGYKPEQTSDSTASEIAKEFNAEFVNLTNVKGLYDKNPKKSKNAKLIREISWKEFDEKAKELEYKPGQHFVLDQSASEIIKKQKIPTYIIKSPSDLDKFLKGEKFTGTTIRG